jgi:hypothetical protein
MRRNQTLEVWGLAKGTWIASIPGLLSLGFDSRNRHFLSAAPCGGFKLTSVGLEENLNPLN